MSSFQHQDIANIDEILGQGFDVVIGLSVLHHLAHRDGYQAARDIADRICSSTTHGIFEFALRTEPLFWAEAQPEAPRDWISGYPFIARVTESRTHLSDVQRPLFFASRTLARASDGLRRWTRTSAHDPTARRSDDARRHFFFDDHMIKVVARFNSNVTADYYNTYTRECRREAKVISDGSLQSLSSIKVIDFTTQPDESVLKRSIFEGTPLPARAANLTVEQRLAVAQTLLQQLAELERIGLYHGDIRPWNVLVSHDGTDATIIDFGAIQDEPRDVIPGLDPMLATMFTLLSLWADGRLTSDGLPLPDHTTDLAAIPTRLLVSLDQLGSCGAADAPFASAFAALNAATVIPAHYKPTSAVRWAVALANQVSDARWRATEPVIAHLRTQLEEQSTLAEEQSARNAELAAKLDGINSELERMYQSRSWRFLEPIRKIASALRRF